MFWGVGAQISRMEISIGIFGRRSRLHRADQDNIKIFLDLKISLNINHESFPESYKFFGFMISIEKTNLKNIQNLRFK